MDLTGIFISRTFNKSESVGASSPPPLQHPNSKHNWDKVPFTGGTRVIDYDADYKELKNYYRNLENETEVDDESIEEYEQQGDYAWAKKHFEDWENRQREIRSSNRKKVSRYTTAEDDFTSDNQMKLYDDIIPMMKNMYQSEVLSVEDEIELIQSYHRGENYVDENHNRIHVVNRTNNYVEVQINLHIGKLKDNIVKIDRVTFLRRMGFKPGTITEDI